ncbi:L-lactate dehydrogenase B chain [Echinococcus granulosus]|uniref:L-lactate dehydrogenase B chain n=1 Tax=Echinococcus granulosus TaxID=6210 RepID=W6UYX9_ECHGR|nr:L-lactate dehydrogenase B chain [Echinococcus granulosus]EUB63882.1 L-lactate dehydrogenase B chain [Echinococcus granulosus]
MATELALIDLDEEMVEAEVKDLQGAAEYYPGCLIYGGASKATLKITLDYKLVSNSTIIIMCEKIPPMDSEDKLNHAQRSLDTFKRIIPHIVESSAKSIVIVVSEPVDIMCYIAWRLSGFEKNRVFGIGTALESAAFRVGISQKLNVSPSTIRAHILGEHGSHSVPIFSSVECGGVRLRSVYPTFGTEKDTEGYNKIPEAINIKFALPSNGHCSGSNQFIKSMKNNSSWSIGLIACYACEAILNDANVIIPLSTHAKNLPGIDKDIFMSLPCIVNANGVRGVMFEDIEDEEKEKLYASAKELEELILSINW